jgi:hypothetical protein
MPWMGLDNSVSFMTWIGLHMALIMPKKKTKEIVDE